MKSKQIKEIGIHLLAYNIIRNLIAQACLRHKTVPWLVSFKSTIQLLEEFLPRLLRSSVHNKSALYKELMRLITTKKVGNRPGVEPRMLKQRRQKFPNLKQPRCVEQQKLKTIAELRSKMIENDILEA